MSREENTGSIPIDIINEIFSRLPAKSVARFSCLSKQWRVMLARPYFKELFSTRSETRPRLLFSFKRDGYEDLCLFSSPQPRDLYEKSSSLVATADSHMKLRKELWIRFGKHAFGFFHFCGSKGMVICNPSTGQLALLPEEEERHNSSNYLVFDPVDKQFKVLSIKSYMSSLILIRGTGDDSWREIYYPLNDLDTFDLPEEICINGVLYYFAVRQGDRSHLIVCFDVRSEEFKFIYRDFFERERKTYREFSLDKYRTKMIN